MATRPAATTHCAPPTTMLSAMSASLTLAVALGGYTVPAPPAATTPCPDTPNVSSPQPATAAGHLDQALRTAQ